MFNSKLTSFACLACLLICFDYALSFFMVEHGYTFVELFVDIRHVVLLNLHAWSIVSVQKFDIAMRPTDEHRTIHAQRTFIQAHMHNSSQSSHMSQLNANTHTHTHTHTHAHTHTLSRTRTHTHAYCAHTQHVCMCTCSPLHTTHTWTCTCRVHTCTRTSGKDQDDSSSVVKPTCSQLLTACICKFLLHLDRPGKE